MIYLCIGDVGAGKSSYLVERVLLPALMQGRRVFTNIRLTPPPPPLPFFPLRPDIDIFPRPSDIPDSIPHRELITEYENFLDVVPAVSVRGDMTHAADRISAGALVIVDEAGLQLRSGIGKEPGERAAYNRMRDYLAQHRHFVDGHGRSTDIFFAAQDTSQVTAQVQNLVSYTIMLRAFRGLIGLRRGAEFRVFSGSPSRADIQTRKGSKGGGYSTIARGIFWAKKTTFQMYRSHDNPDAISGIEMSHIAPAMLPKISLALAAMMIVVIAGFYLSGVIEGGFGGIIGGSVKHSFQPRLSVDDNQRDYRPAGYRVYRGRFSVCYADGSTIVGCRNWQYRDSSIQDKN